jgi:hypothetical protein
MSGQNAFDPRLVERNGVEYLEFLVQDKLEFRTRLVKCYTIGQIMSEEAMNKADAEEELKIS